MGYSGAGDGGLAGTWAGLYQEPLFVPGFDDRQLFTVPVFMWRQARRQVLIVPVWLGSWKPR